MLNSLIAFFLFSLPFQFALNPSPTIDLLFGRVLAGIIILWWLIETLAIKKNIRLPGSILTGVILSFMAWVSLSVVWADNKEFFIRKYLFLMNYLPLLLVFYDRAEEHVIHKWLQALLSGATLSAIIALLLFYVQFFFPVGLIHQWLTTTFLPFFLGHNLGTMVREYSSLLVNIGGETFLRATGLFPDPHVAAFYFGITGLLALGMFLKRHQKIFLIMASLLLIANLLTFSRGGYLGLFVALTTWGVLSWSSFPRYWQTKVVLIIFTLMLLVVSFGQPITSRFLSSFSLNDVSSRERIVLWREAQETIRNNPFFGTGLGNYMLSIRPQSAYREPYYAHNLYLDIGAELGIVGLFLFLSLMVASVFKAASGISKPNNFLSVGLFVCFLLYLTYSFFETALYSAHIFPLLVLLFALAWYDSDTKQQYA